MHAIYDANSLPFWSEDEIMERAHLAERFQAEFKKALSERNRAWRFERIEAPMLIPRELLNPEIHRRQNLRGACEVGRSAKRVLLRAEFGGCAV